jgi:hypothetical protein
MIGVRIGERIVWLAFYGEFHLTSRKAKNNEYHREGARHTQ